MANALLGAADEINTTQDHNKYNNQNIIDQCNNNNARINFGTDLFSALNGFFSALNFLGTSFPPLNFCF